MSNKVVKECIRSHGLKQWEVARHLGVSESTFSIWFRDELDPARVKSIEQACAELSFAKAQKAKGVK